MNDTNPDSTLDTTDMDGVLRQLGFRVDRFRPEPAPKRVSLARLFNIYRTATFACDDTEVERANAKIAALTKRFPRSRFNSFVVGFRYWSVTLNPEPHPQILRKMQVWQVNTVLFPARPELDDYRDWAKTQNLRVINY